ncbi:MAG: N-acetylglucosamine-6-phosphate deacetylase, partial [Chloroflexi bacterium]|nr:N-acetylglucosamine-6-phosphate deacetylase [Chloroflexota bacterium]
MATRTVLIGERAFTPEEIVGPVAVVIENGSIVALRRDTDTLGTETIDLRPWWIAPGYIDLHTHGFGGFDVTGGEPADIQAMAAALPRTGVTAFCPTIASTGPSQTQQQVERIAQATRPGSGRDGAEIIGIRMEGPFISRAKKGAQLDSAIRAPDLDELERWAESGMLRVLDFAPEEDRQHTLLSAVLRHGILPAIGHTACTYEQALAAIDAGARHCTHLFNAMPPPDHRAPGPAGALLSDGRASVEIIAEGVHVHPVLLKLAVGARGARGVALVSDAMHAAGLPDGDYEFVGRPVKVRDGAVRLIDGTLAGSVLTLDRAVRNMVELCGVGWSDAIRMASETPARIVGASRKGALRAGADADLVVLDE